VKVIIRFRQVALNPAWLITVLVLSFCLPVRIWANQSAMVPLSQLIPAPPFYLQDLDGKFYGLSQFRGSVLVVNFWASWCAPCRDELPSMNRAWNILKQEGISMLAINVGEDPQAVSAFNKDYPIDFNLLLDRNGGISQQWQVRGLPTTFIVNAKGEIVYRIIGKREWDAPALLQQLRDLKPSGDIKGVVK
jgi:peroxiredoxin